MNQMKGFTLIEIVIVISIIIIIAGFSLRGINWRNQNDLDLTTNEIIAALRNAQGNSMTQSSSSQWGVYFDNNSPSSPIIKPYYEVFTGAIHSSTNSSSRIILRDSIQFVTPGAGLYKEIVFSTLSGTPIIQTTITVALKSDLSKSKSIIVKTNGQIEY